MEGGSDFMYEFKHNPKRAVQCLIICMTLLYLIWETISIYIYICCITMDLQPQILIQKLTNIYMVECTIPWACEFVELSSRREDYERNLRIAENGELKSLLQKTAAPLREGDLTAGGVLYPLHLGFASHHLFCLVKKGRKTKLKIHKKKNLGTMHVLNQKPTVSKNEDSNLPKLAKWTQNVLMRCLSTTSRELGRITYREIFFKFKWVLKQSIYIYNYIYYNLCSIKKQMSWDLKMKDKKTVETKESGKVGERER